MVRVIGIDPGTKSFDFCGLDDEKIILDISISTKDINKEPELVSNIIKETRADLVVGPSGFGIPITNIKDIGERELFLMSLIKKDDTQKSPWTSYIHKADATQQTPCLFYSGGNTSSYGPILQEVK